MRVAIADLGLGNLRSVERAVKRAALAAQAPVEVAVTGDAAAFAEADCLIFPGQGAFRDGARALASGAGAYIYQHIRSGKPYFGICLGLQLLFAASDEAPGSMGLGIFSGRVRRLGGDHLPAVGSRKVPHMGWNRVHASAGSSLASSLASPLASINGEYMYFIHSFAAVVEDAGVRCATASYGEEITAAVHRQNVLAVQFHPEKSQASGHRLLTEVLGWASRVAGERVAS